MWVVPNTAGAQRVLIISTTLRNLGCNGLASDPSVEVAIASIELDHTGRLLVRPDSIPTTQFEYIYRAATGVKWRVEDHAFYPDEVKNVSPARWFQIIVASVHVELGLDLKLTPQTKWIQVPMASRREIEAHAG